MILNQSQIDFLERRRKLLKLWHYVGAISLIVLFGLVLFLKLNTPQLIDPYEVLARLESGAIDQTSLETMAILLPVMVILVCLMLIILVAMMYMAFSNEKKYLKILNKLEK
jgi:hypothetical protein